MSVLAGEVLHDPLTGLPNRASFAACAAQALSGRPAGAGTAAVFVFDVDRFKDVNDAFGHGIGDELLLALSERLRGALGATDTLARLGGNEFAVLCEHLHGEREAIEVAGRLLDATAAPFVLAERRLFISASVGIVLADVASHTPASLMRDADVALHRAKDQGGGRHAVFDQAMLRRVIERVGLEHDLRRALDHDELVLYFQPLVSLSERRIVAMEALVRWEHPQLGLVPPSAFVPVAEETGLIVPLGRWVLTEACRQFARWSADPEIDLPYLSINLSGRQLAEAGLPEEVAEALRRTGVPADRIALELTESVLMSETASPTAVLQRLKGLGVRLLLDDFGTGYSSLNHLKRFPISGLKVDRSFIAGITDGEQDRHILGAILRMADGLGLEVVAEGVETVDQARMLRGLGCTTVQGYLFAAPAPAAAVERLLRSGLPLDRLAPALSHPAAAAPPAVAPPDPVPDGPTVTLGEAAQALSISISTLRRWADARRIATVRTAGGHRRFPVAEVRRLNQESALATRPLVRAVPVPAEPLPAVAAVLTEARGDLAAAVSRAVYDGGRLGWFAGDAGAAELERFVGVLSSSARTGDWPVAQEAGRRLLLHAHYAGSSLLERHTFLERYSDLLARALAERGAPRGEIVGARRLFARLRQDLLEEPLTSSP